RAEEELRDLKNATGLIVPDGQRQVLVNRAGRLQDELLQTRGALAAAEAEARLLRARLAAPAPTQAAARIESMGSEAAVTLGGQLYALQLRELDWRARRPEGHPDIERVRQQVAAAKEVLRPEEQAREQLTEGPNRVYEETQLALLKQEPLLAAL